MKEKVSFIGMHGLGDAFHERPLLNAASKLYDVEVTTSWPSVFFDLPVRCVRANSTIPYCAQNEADEAHLFESAQGGRRIPVTYLGTELAKGDTFSSSMAKRAQLQPQFKRFAPPDEWGQTLSIETQKPVMVLRPLINRPMWPAFNLRNPLPEVFDAVVSSIRKDYFVVSVADLALSRERLIGQDHFADVKLHSGELRFRQLAWLLSRADLVVSAPGMGVVLPLHMGTPVVGIFGGHENARVYADATPTDFCPIEPITPCCCFDHMHKCDKTTDIDTAIRRAKDFSDAAIRRNHPRAA